MNNVENISKEIKKNLKKNAPLLNDAQKTRMYKILNPDIQGYVIYGIKFPLLEQIVKSTFNTFSCSYEEAIEIFKILIRTNVEDEKFAGLHFLNKFKKQFSNETIDLFQNEYAQYYYTWSLCDSTCVRVLGPFLGKRGNESLAKKTIDEWSNSEHMWIRRASMVILLKLAMIKKEFDEKYVFGIVEKMLKYSGQPYIEKGIGWLLKTCSKYKPQVIYNYLMNNKGTFPRLILRYASEKLPKEKRTSILKK